MRLNDRSLLPQIRSVIGQYFLLNEQERYFFIEWDEFDWEQYLFNSCSVHLNRMG
jgi:hypothetical protein